MYIKKLLMALTTSWLAVFHYLNVTMESRVLESHA